MTAGHGSTFSITLDVTPTLSYAMAHNEVSVVRRVVVDGVPSTVRGAQLRLQLRDATGPVGAPHEVLVDLEAGAPTVLTDVKLPLDPAAMLQIEEQRPGTITARLELHEAVLAEGSARVRLLAGHQWLAEPLALGLEMLAAHVMPNHPAVTALMSEVADLLGTATGNPSIDGYQGGPERVDQIVRAIYQAMQARGIRYSVPQASWADSGQKVRTPGEVLDGCVGTCLDTVVVMAAACEQAGIRPLLWVVDGHAFLGYWRDEASLGSAAQTDAADAVNRVDLGHIGLVETTMLTAGEQAEPFERASAPPYERYLAGDLAEVLGITDVHQARIDRIVPLPARTRDASGTEVVSVYTPRATAPTEITSAASTVPEPPSGSDEPPRVTRWKNALLDLSLRNRLINFTERSKLSLAVPQGRLGRLEDVLHAGQTVSLRASDDISEIDRQRGVRAGRDLPDDRRAELLDQRSVFADITEAAYTTRLRGLAYKARTVLEETGANNLYLALGSLVWDLDGRSLRSPLILVPVMLRAAARGGRYRITLDDAGMSTPNYCLLEKLRQVHGLTVPGLAEPPQDDAGIDLDAAFRATRDALAACSLPYRVEETADLAILQFAKFRLWKDLDESWRTFTTNPLVDHLVHSPTDVFTDPVAGPANANLDELAERCPVPADSSQLRAVAESVAGRTFVLEGPPGTGKSQTITNLLSRAVADGKRVLFVAEKRAALDVVQRRLREVGMGPLSLDLHDKGSRPAAVREQIRQALDYEVPVDHQGLAARLEDLQSARRGLTRYAYKLHEPNVARLSLYSARGAELAIADDVVEMSVPESLLAAQGRNDADALRRLFRTLPDVADPVRARPDHPWAFIDTAGDHAPPLSQVLAAARRLDTTITALPRGGALDGALLAAKTPEDLRLLAELMRDGWPLELLDEVRTPGWNDAAAQAVGQVTEFASTTHPGLEQVTPDALALPLTEIDEAARTAAQSRIFGRKKRLVAVRDRLGAVLREGVQVRPKKLPELTAALVTVADGVQELARQVGSVAGLSLPPGWNPFLGDGQRLLTERIERLRWVASVVDPDQAPPHRCGFVTAVREFLAAGSGVDPREVADAAAAGDAFVRACRVTPEALADWAGEVGLVRAWERSRGARDLDDEDLGSLQQWLRLLAHLEPLRVAGLTEARKEVLRGELDLDDAPRAFDLGLARASVRERSRSTGLEGFDPVTHEKGVQRFVSATSAVREHLSTAVAQEGLRTRPFDPSTTGGQVGQLRRQLSRQRGGMKIRELMSTFGNVITHAMPCVLVSPDSLARFFPATAGLFDIVVFDEASQVRVADAIGAMGRARSVVVVGDSEQMPPTSFAESTAANGDEDSADGPEVVEDEESILTECVQARVHRHRLSWHYRSKDETLIAFSNHHHYDGALSTFPGPRSGPEADAGISLVRVDGHYHRSGKRGVLRTNPVEADAVVAEIRRRFDASPEELPSIGVVTFNQQQREHIEGLLRDSDDPRITEALDEAFDGLFVKNLENVQGDERDVVLFSTAFSVNDRGILPLNFGPLNRAGGERRLNVAVTRSRRKVIVFSSFDPEQLRAEETSSVGIRNLRSYLDLAAYGPSVLPSDPRRHPAPDRHRDEIAEALRSRGLAVRTDVGLSGFKVDLTLAPADQPDRPVVAALLDGWSWYSRPTAGDRDGLPIQVLSGLMGWPAVQRVWLPEWLADRDSVIERLVAVTEEHTPGDCPLQTARSRAIEPGTDERPEPVAAASLETAVSTNGHASRVAAPEPVRSSTHVWRAPAVPFAPWHDGRFGGVDVLDDLPHRNAVRTVGSAIAAVVAAEGPIHLSRLTKLVAGGFGLERVSDSRRVAIQQALPPDLRVDEESVVWPAHRTPEEWTGFRWTPDGVERPLDHVPLREIVNAMVDHSRVAAGMDVRELYREVLAVFGFRRMTARFEERLDSAVDLGVATGRLRVDDDGIVRPT